MTLRSDYGRTYQIVGGEDRVIENELDRLSADSRVAVTLTRAPGRGDGWWVTEIDSQTDRNDPRRRQRSR